MKGNELAVYRYVGKPDVRNQGILLAIMAFSLGVVGLALVSQHVFDMQPCAWCVLQRVEFLTIAIVCGLASITRRSALRLALCSLALLLSLAGVATVVWQIFVANNSYSCSLSLADRIISSLALDQLMPAVFAPRTGCADGAVDLLGIPYELWSLAAFALCALASMLFCFSGAASKVNGRM